MAVCEKRVWYIAVLVGNHAFHIYRLTRNQGEEKPGWCDASLYVEDGEIDALSGAAEAFLTNVKNDTPPAVDGAEATTEALSERFPDGNGSTTDLFGREHLIQSWFQLRKARKGLEEQEKEIRNVLCADLGNSEVSLCGQHKVTWRTQTRSTFDAKSCVADHPEMAAYYKTSTSRVFGIK
jgi:predicted phage-related endonuclease